MDHLPTKIRLQIASVDRLLVDEVVDEVEIPGSEGYFGVLPGHTPLLAQLGAGELWYRQGQSLHYFVIALGFAEVQPDRVTILADAAERVDEIDFARAEAAKVRAEQELQFATADIEAERASLALARALARLKARTRTTGRG